MSSHIFEDINLRPRSLWWNDDLGREHYVWGVELDYGTLKRIPDNLYVITVSYEEAEVSEKFITVGFLSAGEAILCWRDAADDYRTVESSLKTLLSEPKIPDSISMTKIRSTRDLETHLIHTVGENSE